MQGRKNVYRSVDHVRRRTDLRDYINFMVCFRASLNRLKPSEIIPLQSTEADTFQRMLREVILGTEPLEMINSYCYMEPYDFCNGYLKQEVKRGWGSSKPFGRNKSNSHCTT
ncbi:hypothetical protein TNIN_495621 [Trichonephila inaurata madagascariensis]|uniref:Uncharacterized protein n=1 Tax=Trichonephila inaurata madagascariensis TaxID=2747483 RepID=A0A8X6XPM3_9ARAC|nr:hypothetical protein TNIN_495621 [Trichonephila inaurata madagascariensis]